jgi:hypothetical protein
MDFSKPFFPLAKIFFFLWDDCQHFSATKFFLQPNFFFFIIMSTTNTYIKEIKETMKGLRAELKAEKDQEKRNEITVKLDEERNKLKEKVTKMQSELFSTATSKLHELPESIRDFYALTAMAILAMESSQTDDLRDLLFSSNCNTHGIPHHIFEEDSEEQKTIDVLFNTLPQTIVNNDVNPLFGKHVSELAKLDIIKENISRKRARDEDEE